MGLGDELRNAAAQAKGKAKVLLGKATGNKRLQNEGKADQAKAKVKKAALKVKNAIKDALD